MIHASDLRQCLLEKQSDLLSQPCVRALGIGETATDGEMPGAPAFVVLMVKDDDSSDLTLPKTIKVNGVQVPVVIRGLSKKCFQLTNNAVDGSDFLLASKIGRTGTPLVSS